MPYREQLIFDKHQGHFRLPRVLLKVCVHNADASLPVRFRGDMAFDIDTYAGMREEVYKCIQCGKTKSADKLWALVQAYILLGDELAI